MGISSPLFRPERVHQTPKQQRINNTTLLVCFSVILLVGIVGMIFLVPELQGQPITMLTETSHTELDVGTTYYMDQISVVDAYALEEGNLTQNTTEWALLIYFYDREDQPCYGSMTVNKTSPLWERCNDYVTDTEAFVGELILNGYFSCRNIAALDSPLPTYYREGYELYNETIPGINTEKHFVYLGTTEKEAAEVQRGEVLEDLGVLSGVIIVDIVGILVIVWMRKKIPTEKKDGKIAAEDIVSHPEPIPGQGETKLNGETINE